MRSFLEEFIKGKLKGVLKGCKVLMNGEDDILQCWEVSGQLDSSLRCGVDALLA